jgi:phosphinothricin acetyltransferase
MRLLIRHADPARDAAACAEIYAPYVRDSAVSFELSPPTPAEFAERIERISRTHPFLVAEREGGLAGYAYACPHRERAAYRWAAEVAVYVAAPDRRHGVGRALYQDLFELLARQGLRMACAGITLPNDASVALHEACGFRLVGTYRRIGWKAGAWRDVAWLQRELGAPSDEEPAEPGPPARLDAT